MWPKFASWMINDPKYGVIWLTSEGSGARQAIARVAELFRGDPASHSKEEWDSAVAALLEAADEQEDDSPADLAIDAVGWAKTAQLEAVGRNGRRLSAEMALDYAARAYGRVFGPEGSPAFMKNYAEARTAQVVQATYLMRPWL